VRSRASTLVTGDVAFRVRPGWKVQASIFNLLDAEVADIDYHYTSRLPGEPLEGVDDIHTHPSAPRTFRLSLVASF
jgi:hypothetical protein